MKKFRRLTLVFVVFTFAVMFLWSKSQTAFMQKEKNEVRETEESSPKTESILIKEFLKQVDGGKEIEILPGSILINRDAF